MLYLEKYSWSTEKNVSVTGFAWLGEEYFCGQNFVAQTQKHTSNFGQFKDFVSRLNGQFSIVVHNEKETWAKCCHTWSFPLFYKVNNGVYSISDQPKRLQQANEDKEIDTFVAAYFKTFGVTPKDTTLCQSVFQVRPGQALCLSAAKNKSFDLSQYFEFTEEQSKKERSGKALQDHLTVSFGKYYEQIKNKQVLLPLTGGYDSRLLACLLAEYGHKNTICATWGRKNSYEKQTAQRIATKMGFPHFPVDYTETTIRDFTKTEEFDDYVRFVGHNSSMPFFYEYFGLKDLLAKEIINTETVALPGHPGDFLKGSHLNRDMQHYTSIDFIAHLISCFGTSTPLSKRKTQQLSSYLEENYFSGQKKELLHNYELWDLEERQCKFIGNSSMIYSFFKMKYFMPLFDWNTLRFFHKIPFSQRIGEALYNQTMETIFFKKYKIDFDLKTTEKKQSSTSKFKNYILQLTPHVLKQYYYPMNDPIFYREIAHELRRANKHFKYKHPLRPHFYNSYIAQWYLQYIGRSSG